MLSSGSGRKLALVEPCSRDILVAMGRRACILILASVVSFLAMQAEPARAEDAHDSYVLLWQSESRVRRPAPSRTIAITRQRFASASRVPSELSGHALNRSILSGAVRAPPIWFARI